MTINLGGVDKLLSAPVFSAEYLEEMKGVFLVLQKDPFNYKNPEHLNNRKRVEEYLDLREIHKGFHTSDRNTY